MAFAADRMASASSGWAGSLDDFDITAEVRQECALYRLSKADEAVQLPTRFDMYSEGVSGCHPSQLLIAL